MKLPPLFAATLLVLLTAGRAHCDPASDSAPEMKTARTAPAQYYVSLPKGWNAATEWPVLVCIEGSGHDFLRNCQGFIKARGERPFVIVTPLVSSNGNDPADLKAVLAIVREVQQDEHGQAKFFMTGFSAGGHLTWQVILMHPELLAGAAPCAASFLLRGVGEISTAPERVHLPIHAFQGDKDASIVPLNRQWGNAESFTRAHGYENVTRTVVPDAGHSPFPVQRFDFFASLLPKP